MSAFAQEAPPAPPVANNLDLGSADKSVSAASVIQPAAQATINLGTTAVTYHSTDMITAAEMVAVRQVMATGRQFLQLNDQGVAVGGGLHLQYYASNLNNLVIPEGVRASQNAAVLSSLSLTGNLTNSGTFNIFSSNPNVTAATINATNIYNNVSGLINSSLATLNLNAINNIVNNGTIMSAGNLNMTAGGSITNMAMMQAANNLALQATSIANSGTMAAQLGNINMATQQLTNSAIMQALAGNINIKNSLNPSAGLSITQSETAVLSALNGSINFNVVDSSLKAIMDINGGSLLAQGVNFNNGDGHLNISIRDLAGTVDISSGTANLAVSHGTHGMNINSFNITGDPNLTYTGSGPFSNGAFSALGGYVDIDTSSDTVNGSITFTGAITTTTSSGTSTAGYVKLNAGTFINTQDITTTGGNGGTFAGGGGNNGASAGSITLTAVNNITTGNLNANGGGGQGAGGGSGSGGNGGVINVTSNTGIVTVNGMVSAYGGGGGGAGGGAGNGGTGGTIGIYAFNGTISTAGMLNVSGGGGGGGNSSAGSAGSITAAALTSIFIDGPVLAAGGGAGGCCSSNSGGGGGSFGGGGGAAPAPVFGPGVNTLGGSGGGLFGVGGQPASGGGGYYGGAAGGTGSGAQSSGGGGGGGTGGTSPLGAGGNGTLGQGGSATTTTTGATAGTNAGTSGGGTITLLSTKVAINKTVGTGLGFTTSPFANYSAYAGTGGTIQISTPAVYYPDANYQTGTASTKALLGSTSFTVGTVSAGSGSAGSLQAGNGVYINRTNVGTSVSSGTTGVASSSLSITENGGPKTINSGDFVTPAEWVAVSQFLNGGQTVTLDGTGNATGGIINFSALNVPGGGFTNFVLPAGITSTATASSITANTAITLHSNLTYNTSVFTLSAPTITVDNGITVQQSSGTMQLAINTNNLTNNGTLRSGILTSFTALNNGNLTIGGNGTININQTGSNFVIFYAYAGTNQSLSFTGDQQLTFTGTPTITYYVYGSGSSINFASNTTQTIGNGATVNMYTPSLTFGSSASYVASGASALTFANFGAMTVTTPDNSGATISSNGGTIHFTPSSNQSIVFAKSGAVGPAYLYLNDAPTTITTTGAASTTINANVNLVSNTTITVVGTLNNNGSITQNSVLLTSLDLTDPSVTSYIQTQQGLGHLGGTLILTSGVAQPGSTLTIVPGNLSSSLSSFNVPTGVVVTMNSFTTSDTITIDVTGSSFTNQATLTGTAAFGSGSGKLVITSTLAGTAFVINSAGTLSSSATLDISASRDISIAGTITASTLSIQTTANNGAIGLTSTASVTGTAGITLTTNGTGNITSALSSILQSTNAPITITANDVSFAGTVNAGAGTVSLIPNGTQSMSLNGAGGTFSVLSSDLSAITALTLVLGSSSSTGGITLASALTLPSSGTAGSTAGLYNLDLRSGGAGGTYTAGSNALNIRGQNLTINVAGSANTGSGGISGTAGTVSISGGGVTVGSAINLSGNGAINLTSTGSTNITLNNNLSTASGGQISLTTGTGNVSQGGSISTGSLVLSSTSGSFNLTTTASNLTANTTGGVNVTNTGALTIGPAGATNTGNSFTVSNNQTITVSGAITATSISGLTLTTTANNGDININANVTGGGVTISANGNGVVTNAISTDINATTSTLQITASNVIFNGTVTGQGGDVMLLANGSIPVVIGGTSGTFNVTQSVINAVSADLNLLIGYGSSMTVVGPVDISSANFDGFILQPSGNYSATGQTITIGSKQFRAEILTSGTINTGTVTGLSGSDIYFHSQLGQTIDGAITGGTMTFQNDTSGDITFSAGVSGTFVNISGGASDQIAQTTGTITSPQIIFYGPNGIGLLSPIQTITNNIQITAGSSASAFITNAGALQITSSTAGNQLQVTTTGSSAHITTSGTITATNGALQLIANGNITITNVISGDTLTLQTSAGSNGNITLNHNVTGTNGVTISTNGNGNVTNAVTRSISATNALISITANDVSFSGTVNAGANGSVSLIPNGAKSISVGGAGGTFSVLAADLSAITAGTLTVGTTAQVGGFTVGGNLNVSGAGPAGAYNLIFNNGGNYTAAGRTIALGTKTLTVNALGTVDTGTVAGGNTTISLSGGTGLTVSNSVTVTGGTLTLATTNSGNISIGANVGSGSGTANINANGSGTITRSANVTITGTTVNLTSDSGNIGSNSTRIQTAATTLTVNSSAANNFVQNTGSVAIGTSTVNGVLDITTIGPSAHITTSGNISTPNGSLFLTADGNITTSNTISGSALVFLTTFGSAGSITLNSDVSGIASVSFTTDGAGNVTNAVSTTISSGNGVLPGDITIRANDVAFSGSVNSINNGTVTLRPNGIKSISVGGTGGTFSVVASDLSAITASTLVVGSTTIAGGLTVAGNLDVSGAGPTGAYNLQFNNGGNYTAAGQTITLGTHTLTVNVLGTVTTGTVTGGNTTVSLTGGTGLTVSGAVTVTGGTVSLATNNGGDVTISANVGGGASSIITADNSIIHTAGTVSGTNVSLIATDGAIGTNLVPILTDAGSGAGQGLTLTANDFNNGFIYIQESNDVRVQASSSGNFFKISAAGNITTEGVLSNGHNDGFILQTTAANGSITLNADLLSDGGTTIATNGAGNFIMAAGTTLSTNGNQMLIQANDVDFGGLGTSINVGTNDLDIWTNGNKSVVVAGAGGTFNLSSAELGNITTSNLNISDQGAGGGFTVAGNINVSVGTPGTNAGAYNLYFSDANTYTATGQTITLGARTLSVTAGTLNTGNVTGGNTTVTLTGGSGGLTATGTVSVVTGTVTLATTNSGAITIAGNVGGGTTTNVNANGSGTVTRSGNFTISGTTVDITSSSGDIGQSGTPILTDALFASASTSGSIYLSNTTDLNTSAFSIGAAGTLDLSTTANGSIAIDSNVTADTIRLSAAGSGNIDRTGNVTLTADDITLQTTSGNIGDLGNEIQTAAGTLTVSSGGSVLINEADSVDLAASTIGGTFVLATTGSDGAITITGDIGATSMLLSTDGTGNIERSGNFTLTASVVNLGSDNGNFGTPLAPLQLNAGSTTIQTGGSALISETNSIFLGFTSVGGTFELTTGTGGSITLSDIITATSMTITAGGNGTITNGGSGSLSASVINLVSGSGNIGASGNEIETSANVLTANTTGSIYINEANGITLGFTNAGGTLEITTGANGSISIADQVSATTMTLTADGLGTITRGGLNTLSATTMTLNSTLGDIGSPGTPLLTDAGSLTVNTGGGTYVTNANSFTLANSTVGGQLTISTNGTLTTSTNNSGSSVNITAGALDNSGTLSATAPTGTLTVTGAGGLGVIISGGGTLAGGGGVTIDAADQAVQFTGNQTFTGDATINANGATGDVTASIGVSVFSSGNLTINSTTPLANPAAFGAGGTLTINAGPPAPPPAPPAPASEESTPTLIALVADASGASGSQLVTSRNDPILISTDQNQGVAGSSLSQSLLTGITNGLTTIIFGGTGGSSGVPSPTISNSNSLSNAPNTGLPSGNVNTASGPIVNGDVDLTPFADLLPSGSMDVSGNIVGSNSNSGGSKGGALPPALTAEAGKIIPAQGPSQNKQGEGNALSSLGEVFKVGTTRSDLVMFTMANQVFSGFIGGNSDTMVSGTPGTVFSTDKNTVVLHTGHMMTDNGKQGMTVFTNSAAVMIGADSAAVIDVHPGAPTRVMAVAGQGSASTTVRTRDGLVIPLAAGQEVIIGQTDLSDEDLIPVDGMDREFVSGGIQVSSRKVAKDNFSLDEFMDKEIMVAGVPVRLGGSNKRLHGKISAAAKRQSRNSNIADNYHKKKKGSGNEDDDKDTGVITKAPAKEAPIAQNSNEPARLLAEKDSQFSLMQPGHMKLIKGSLFMHSGDPTIIDTPLGQVRGTSGSMFKVTSDEGKTRVQAMSGPDDISVVAGKRLIPLNCGKEVFISDHKPSQSETVPADGVGRRGMSAYALDGALSAIVGDFSMVTLLNSATYLNPLRHPVSGSDQQLHAQIVKAAAVIQQVLGNRGRYFIAPKEHASAPLPDWVFKTTGSKPDDLPLLKALLDNQSTVD